VRKRQENGENYISVDVHNLFPSPNSIKAIRSRRMRWAGHVDHGRDEIRTQNSNWKTLCDLTILET
jgi:hypothetical protein